MAGTAQNLRAATNHLLDGDTRRMKADLSALQAELERVLEYIKDTGEGAVSTARQQSSAVVDRMAANAGSMLDDLGERGQVHAARIGRRVQAQPMLAIGVAFGAGLLVGALAANRR
jgi:ElaB/YqjD/DUF883 family membrane-anchored ribosome-binding protein